MSFQGKIAAIKELREMGGAAFACGRRAERDAIDGEKPSLDYGFSLRQTKDFVDAVCEMAICEYKAKNEPYFLSSDYNTHVAPEYISYAGYLYKRLRGAFKAL